MWENTLGVTCYRAEQWQEAIDALTKSIEHGFDVPHNWLFIAMAHWQLDQQDQAQEWYNKCLAWKLDHPGELGADTELQAFFAEAAELMDVREVESADSDEAPAESQQEESSPENNGAAEPVSAGSSKEAQQDLERDSESDSADSAAVSKTEHGDEKWQSRLLVSCFPNPVISLAFNKSTPIARSEIYAFTSTGAFHHAPNQPELLVEFTRINAVNAPWTQHSSRSSPGSCPGHHLAEQRKIDAWASALGTVE